MITLSVLKFFHGTMGSAKSATLLMKYDQMKRSGKKCILLKPAKDSRWENGMITSRVIAGQPCISVDNNCNLKELVLSKLTPEDSFVFVLIDEVQFLTKEHIHQAWELTIIEGLTIEVLCFGLKNNYMNEPFEASSALFSKTNNLTVLESKCCYCNNDADTHLLLINGEIIKSGDPFLQGDLSTSRVQYKTVCQKCYYSPPQNL